MFRILVDGIDGPVGSIGYWERQWHGDTVYETGWSVLPPYQGRGIATAAIGRCLEDARAEAKHGCVHAFPRVEHLASNAICRKSGFTLVAECDFEYPAGNPIRCNDWSYDLRTHSPS